MIINKLIDYLIEDGFEDKQINQLVKIQEAEYDLIEDYGKKYGNEINIISDGYINVTDSVDKLRELKNILINNKFNNEQLTEILEGYKTNLNYEMYSDLKFDYLQMREIRLGLEFGIDVTLYYDIKYNNAQMYQIKCGLEEGIDITSYCDEKYSYKQMLQIRSGLEANIDINVYNDLKYNTGQMIVLKKILIHNKHYPDRKVDIELFQNEKLSSYDMACLFNMLNSNNQDTKIEAYRQLNVCKKENNKNKINTHGER
jgi:hypothetical protein